jgi:hypothetical protein
MTRTHFQVVARRVRLYGNLLIWATGSAVMTLASVAVWRAAPAITAFGIWLRGQVQAEALVGLIGGLAVSVVLVPLALIPLAPALWVDRRFGLRCAGCGRSVTLRCQVGQVLRTGRCCFCQRPLFGPDGSAAAAEPNG